MESSNARKPCDKADGKIVVCGKMDGRKVRKIPDKIGFIGGGNMAKAICTGMVQSGLVSYSQIYVSTAHKQSLVEWEKLGANPAENNAQVAKNANIVFLSVKPHMLAEAVANIFDNISNRAELVDKLFVSVLAGITIESLQRILDFPNTRIIRVMPNTPMMVGEGCSVFCPSAEATEEDIRTLNEILSCSGVCRMVPEAMITAVGALAGSGPAYIYLVIESLSDAGVKMGLPREMATQFAAQTVLGAAKMVLETKRHPGQLKDEVCSPGGTTITGIHALEKAGVRSAFMDAVECAAAKSLALGQSYK